MRNTNYQLQIKYSKYTQNNNKNKNNQFASLMALLNLHPIIYICFFMYYDIIAIFQIYIGIIYVQNDIKIILSSYTLRLYAKRVYAHRVCLSEISSTWLSIKLLIL